MNINISQKFNISFLILLFFITSNLLSNELKKEACKKAGGKYDQSIDGCFCKWINTYINPAFEKCAEKIATPIESFFDFITNQKKERKCVEVTDDTKRRINHNNKLICPAYLLDFHEKLYYGSVAVSPPFVSCDDKTEFTDKRFGIETAEDLERFLHKHPQLGVESKLGNITSCIPKTYYLPGESRVKKYRENYKIGNKLKFGIPTAKVPEFVRKTMLIEWFVNMNKISNTYLQIVSNIASLDNLLQNQILKGVSCIKRIISGAKDWCRKLRKCETSKESEFDTMLEQTNINFPSYINVVNEIESLERELREIQDYPIRINDRRDLMSKKEAIKYRKTVKRNNKRKNEIKKELEVLYNAKVIYEQDFPWFTGKVFQENIKQNDKRTNYRDTLVDQIKSNRAQMIKDLKKFQKAALCLNDQKRNSEYCVGFDETMQKTDDLYFQANVTEPAYQQNRIVDKLVHNSQKCIRKTINGINGAEDAEKGIFWTTVLAGAPLAKTLSFIPGIRTSTIARSKAMEIFKSKKYINKTAKWRAYKKMLSRQVAETHTSAVSALAKSFYAGLATTRIAQTVESSIQSCDHLLNQMQLPNPSIVVRNNEPVCPTGKESREFNLRADYKACIRTVKLNALFTAPLALPVLQRLGISKLSNKFTQSVSQSKLGQKGKEFFGNYGKEIKETKPWYMRLFLRNTNNSEEPRRAFANFAHVIDPTKNYKWYQNLISDAYYKTNKPFYKLYNWLTKDLGTRKRLVNSENSIRYSFKPFSGLYHNIIRVPIRKITNQVSTRLKLRKWKKTKFKNEHEKWSSYRNIIYGRYEKDFTLPLVFAFDIYWIEKIFGLLDHLGSEEVKNENSLEDFKPEWDRLIEYDIRFYSVKKFLKKNPKKKKEARKMALAIYDEYNKFYKMMEIDTIGKKIEEIKKEIITLKDDIKILNKKIKEAKNKESRHVKAFSKTKEIKENQLIEKEEELKGAEEAELFYYSTLSFFRDLNRYFFRGFPVNPEKYKYNYQEGFKKELDSVQKKRILELRKMTEALKYFSNVYGYYFGSKLDIEMYENQLKDAKNNEISDEEKEKIKEKLKIAREKYEYHKKIVDNIQSKKDEKSKKNKNPKKPLKSVVDYFIELEKKYPLLFEKKKKEVNEPGRGISTNELIKLLQIDIFMKYRFNLYDIVKAQKHLKRNGKYTNVVLTLQYHRFETEIDINKDVIKKIEDEIKETKKKLKKAKNKQKNKLKSKLKELEAELNKYKTEQKELQEKLDKLFEKLKDEYEKSFEKVDEIDIF